MPELLYWWLQIKKRNIYGDIINNNKQKQILIIALQPFTLKPVLSVNGEWSIFHHTGFTIHKKIDYLVIA